MVVFSFEGGWLFLLLLNNKISKHHTLFLLDYLCGPKKGRYCSLLKRKHLCTFSADPTGQLDVLWHDGNTLGVDGAQVGILEKTNQVSLASLLKSHDGRALEPEIGLEILSNFSY